MRWRWGWLAVCGLLWSGCHDRELTAAQNEIANEVRSLRIAWQEQEGGRPQQAAAAFDAEAFAAALQPLREVMTALARDLSETQMRQAALTTELTRWSQLLAQNVTGTSQDEAKALAARLQALEATLQAQDERHREVEAMIGGALEKTSAQLESFLQRLEGVSGPGKEGTVKPSPDSGQAEPVQESASPTGAPPPGGNGGEDQRQSRAELGARRSGFGEGSLWWFGIAAIAILAGGSFAFWLRRENAAATVLSGSGNDHEPGLDGGVEDLWAAAAMLGEAVGKLRHNEPGAESEAQAVLQQLGPAAMGELFAIPDGDLQAMTMPPAAEFTQPASLPNFTVKPNLEPTVEPEPAPEPAPEPQPVAIAPANAEGPCWLQFVLLPADPGAAVGRVLATLESDGRVLRRPAPEVRLQAGRLEIRFAVLAELVGGERGQLEQAVRAAAR